ncbi:RNA polymerase sigma-70 factor [Clostridium botulinum B str. Eklund 17B (NRP)]|nr:RNA polymerase sigma-70 factor [Clostridium botulinum B str. Eklund 17B (NRP)]
MKGLEYENIDDLNISTPDNVHEGIVKCELESDIEQILNCLKEKDRELFYKLYIEENEVNDITKEMGIKREIIYNRLSRGKKRIQKIFKTLESRG